MLSQKRVEAEVTQVMLCSRIGTSQSMLSKLERGVVRMDITDLLDYLHGIDVDPVEFMAEYLTRICWKPIARDTQRAS